MTIAGQLQSNLQRVRDRMAARCERSGRDVAEVRLVAVVKYAQLDWVRALLDLGVEDLGESRPQQLVERAGLLPQHVRWHLIGHLQRNKARKILPLVELIHSVDSFRLLTALDRLAEELHLRPQVLMEVNVAGEASKDGLVQQELLDQWPQMVELSHVQIEGLMTMAPLTDDVNGARGVFRGLRELRDRLSADSPEGFTLPHLSMGMSQDFETAIEEGATLVRIGSELFAGLE